MGFRVPEKIIEQLHAPQTVGPRQLASSGVEKVSALDALPDPELIEELIPRF